MHMLWKKPFSPINAMDQFYEPGEAKDNHLLTVFHNSLPYDKINDKMPDKILIEDQSLFDEMVKLSVQNGLS